MKLINSTKCPCGRELKGERFEKYKPVKADDRFYGGRVTMIGEVICECGRELKGYFQNTNNGVDLIDLEVIRDIAEPEKIDSEPTSEVVLVETETIEPYNAEIKEELPEEGTKPDFDVMTYKDLQAYAKEKGIKKTNVAREKLIEQLISL